MPKIRLNCNRCGQFYYKRPSKASSSKYCSKDCQYPPKTRFNCSWCGRFIWRHLSQVGERVFCDYNCRDKHRMDRCRIELTCDNCGEVFERRKSVHKHSVGSTKKVYCSDSCNPFTTHLYPKTYKLRRIVRTRKRNKRLARNLGDEYIKRQISSTTNYSFKNVPDDLIRAKRVQLMARRQANNNLKITPELCQNVNLPLTT